MSSRVEAFLESIRNREPELALLVLHGGSANAAI